MRVCEQCGRQNEDEFAFCATCGARLDGKATCGVCRRAIPADAAVCPYCGTRRDGKTYCSSCGKLIAGDSVFCPYCGGTVSSNDGNPQPYAPQQYYAQPFAAAQTPYENLFEQPKPARVPVRAANPAKRRARDRVFGILTNSFGLAALAVMVICCFLSVFTGVSKSFGSESIHSIDFLVEMWEDVSLLIDKTAGMKDVYLEGIILMAVMDTIAIAGNIIVSVVMFILGAVFGIRALVSGKPCKIEKYVIGAFVPWVFLSMILASGGMDLDMSSIAMDMPSVANDSVYTRIGDGVISVLVIVSALLVANFVLKTIQYSERLKCKSGVMAISGIGAILVCFAVFSGLISTEIISMPAVGIKTRLLASVYSFLCSSLSSDAMLAYSVVLFILYLGVAAVCMVLLLQILLNLFNGKRLRCNYLWQAIVLFVLSILIVVFTSLFLKAPTTMNDASMADAGAKVSAQLIIAVVFGGLMLAAALVFFIFDAQAQPKRYAYATAGSMRIIPQTAAPAPAATPVGNGEQVAEDAPEKPVTQEQAAADPPAEDSQQ